MWVFLLAVSYSLFLFISSELKSKEIIWDLFCVNAFIFSHILTLPPLYSLDIFCWKITTLGEAGPYPHFKFWIKLHFESKKKISKKYIEIFMTYTYNLFNKFSAISGDICCVSQEVEHFHSQFIHRKWSFCLILRVWFLCALSKCEEIVPFWANC